VNATGTEVAATTPAPTRAPASKWRRDVASVGLVVGAVWGIGALLPVGEDRPGLVYVVSDYVYTAMLATYALVGWLAVRLAPGHASVRAFAGLLAIAGLVAALGNFLEDVLAVGGSEYLYGVGLFGSLAGFAGLTAALVAARHRWLAAAVGLTLIGLLSMAGHGPPLVPLLWLAIAAWGLAGARRDVSWR
jgi:hypothetical protein